MKYENSWTRPGEGFISEIDFSSKKALASYQAKHDMRPTTKVNVAGNRTTAVDVLGKTAFDKDKKSKENFKSQRKNDKKDIDRDIKGNGGSLGGFSLNFSSKEDEEKALKAVKAYADEHGIKDFGSYENKGMGSAKGRNQIYIHAKGMDHDVADLFKKLAKDGEVVGKSVAGKGYQGSFKK